MVQKDCFVELGGQWMVAIMLQPALNNAPVDGSPHSNYRFGTGVQTLKHI